MAGHETAADLQNDEPLEMPASPDTSESPAAPILPQSAPLLPARASAVQVLCELDQLLTMDTLIYFAQAVVELFWLSFHFAYVQQIKPPPPPPETSSEPASDPPSPPTPRTSDQPSKRQIARKKPKRSRHKTPKRDTNCPAPTISTQSNLSVIHTNTSEENSDTGPALCTQPTNPVRVPALLKSDSLVLPVALPAVLRSPTRQPSIPRSLAAESDSTAPLGPAFVPSPPTTSHQRQTSPRRKPVPSPFRKTSAKFDRPAPATPPNQPQLISDTIAQPYAIEDHVVPDPQKPQIVSTPPPSQPSRQPRSQTPPPEHFIPADPPAQPIAVSQITASPLVRKSSAKFIRPAIQSAEETVVAPAPVVDPTPEPQSPEQPPVQHPVESQHQTEDLPQIIEPLPQRLVSFSKLAAFPPRPAIAIVQAIPPSPPSPPPFCNASVAEEEPVLPIPSFPQLPSLIPSNPRLPPPPPSIPRFPSPSKPTEHIVSVPDSIISSNSEPQPSRVRIPKRRPVSMAAVASPSEMVPAVIEKGWGIRPETAYNLPLPSSEVPKDRPDWDPSHDDNLFSATPLAAPKTAVSSTPSRQFSSHGSITSHSSNDSPPPNSSSERLPSPPSMPEVRKHVRAASNHSLHVPSPIPSPRARPHSAGSISSGSDYILPAFTFDNTHLKPGNAAALLSHAETLNMYRQNAKKAVDNPATQYEFAIFMMDAARDAAADANPTTKPGQIKDLLKEGLSILRRLADRGYPQAQYYLADCYTNGIGCKHNAPDLEKAFPLFVLAAKHGHVEASFRAALAYENAWGCRRDPLKALQFLKYLSPYTNLIL